MFQNVTECYEVAASYIGARWGGVALMVRSSVRLKVVGGRLGAFGVCIAAFLEECALARSSFSPANSGRYGDAPKYFLARHHFCFIVVGIPSSSSGE